VAEFKYLERALTNSWRKLEHTGQKECLLTCSPASSSFSSISQNITVKAYRHISCLLFCTHVRLGLLHEGNKWSCIGLTMHVGCLLLGWPYTVGTWLYCDCFIWCVSCTVVVVTCCVMCGCVYVWVL
jgi:hypothetical protein